jgi:hypothetical protein
MYKMHHPEADMDGLCVKKKGEEEEACHKLKQHIKQRQSIMQNILTKV